MRPAALWGTREAIERMFGDGATAIELTPQSFTFRYISPEDFVQFFRAFYGPVHKAFEALGDRAPAFEADLLALIAEHNRATDGTMVVPSDYAEVVIRKA